MIHIKAIVWLIIISIIIAIPLVMIVCGFAMKLEWWMRIALVGGGLLYAWLVKPLSILTGKDLKII